jgi:hypothetical protein
MSSALLPFDESTVSLDLKPKRRGTHKKKHKPKREPGRIELCVDRTEAPPSLETVFPQETSPLYLQSTKRLQRGLVLGSLLFSTLAVAYLAKPVTLPTTAPSAVITIARPTKNTIERKKVKRRVKRSSAQGLALGR